MLSESVFPKLGSLAFASSAALSSFIFAIMHFSYGSLAEIAVAFSIGLILCASIRKWGSLVPAIVAHALFNFASVAAMVLS
jgi:membrane protease YdiL (CAAX protease family)